MIPVPDRIRRRYRDVRDMVTPATKTCAAPGCTNTAAPFADHEVAHGQYVCGARCMGRVIRPALKRTGTRA